MKTALLLCAFLLAGCSRDRDLNQFTKQEKDDAHKSVKAVLDYQQQQNKALIAKHDAEEARDWAETIHHVGQQFSHNSDVQDFLLDAARWNLECATFMVDGDTTVASGAGKHCAVRRSFLLTRYNNLRNWEKLPWKERD